MKAIKRIIVVVAVALIAGLSLRAAEERSRTEPARRGDDLRAADAKFVREAAKSGAAEVQFGRLVKERAQDAQLKNLGQHLITDHTKTNEKLAQLARTKGLPVIEQPSEEAANALQKLEKLSGSEFDEAARRHAIESHQKEIRRFTEAVSKVEDSELRFFAQETLPVLQQHLRHAEEIRLAQAKR